MRNRKYLFIVLPTACLLLMGLNSQPENHKKGYDPSYVKIISSVYNGVDYCCIRMSRKNAKIKAKYFAHEMNGIAVKNRFYNWKADKQVIVACAGTYFSRDQTNKAKAPVGLCVDNGTIINYNFETNMDGIIIVYATGGIVAVNAKTTNVNVVENGQNVSYDVKNEYQKNKFLQWAENNNATVFQTHLLAKDNKNLVAENSSKNEMPRRFLAVSKGLDNNLYHSLIYTKTNITLRKFTIGIMDYLRKSQQMKEISFIINLDTGDQDWIQTYESDGKIKPFSAGSCLHSEKSEVKNILTYHFE